MIQESNAIPQSSLLPYSTQSNSQLLLIIIPN